MAGLPGTRGGLPAPLPDSPPGPVAAPVVIPLADVIDETREDLASAEPVNIGYLSLPREVVEALDPGLFAVSEPPEAAAVPGDLDDDFQPSPADLDDGHLEPRGDDPPLPGVPMPPAAPEWARALVTEVAELRHAVITVGQQQQWMVDAFGSMMAQFQGAMQGGGLSMIMNMLRPGKKGQDNG